MESYVCWKMFDGGGRQATGFFRPEASSPIFPPNLHSVHKAAHTTINSSPMPEPQPLHHSQLLFPSAHISINKTLTDLKRSNLTISNRLKSIAHDARFVQNVASAYQLPLIANERCGSWYVPPSLKAGSAYFKSTDGHYGQWSFSLRRLNLQILDVVGEFGG